MVLFHAFDYRLSPEQIRDLDPDMVEWSLAFKGIAADAEKSAIEAALNRK